MLAAKHEAATEGTEVLTEDAPDQVPVAVIHLAIPVVQALC